MGVDCVCQTIDKVNDNIVRCVDKNNGIVSDCLSKPNQHQRCLSNHQNGAITNALNKSKHKCKPGVNYIINNTTNDVNICSKYIDGSTYDSVKHLSDTLKEINQKINASVDNILNIISATLNKCSQQLRSRSNKISSTL